MTNSTIVSPVKMEYGWNFSISGLKMMVKSGLENIFEILPCAQHVIFITEFVLLIKIPTFFEVNDPRKEKDHVCPGHLFFKKWGVNRCDCIQEWIFDYFLWVCSPCWRDERAYYTAVIFFWNSGNYVSNGVHWPT